MRNMVAVSTCLILVFAVLFFIDYGYAAIDLSTAVGIWLFDDGSGTTAKDSSGSGNDGTLEGGAAWTADGKSGGAIDFNGTDACVQIGEKLLDGLEEFTIIAWINPNGLTGGRIGLVGQNDSPEFGINPAGTIALWTPTGGTVAHPYDHPDGEWHLVAGVADENGKTTYVDKDSTSGGDAGNHGSSDFGVNIGGCGIWDAEGNWFTGGIDDVAIFHSALTADDIAFLVDNGLRAVLTAVEPAGKLAVSWGAIKNAK